MKVQIKEVRLSFPQLFEPKTVGGEGEPRFSAAFVIVPGSTNAQALDAAIEAAAKEKWKDKAAGILKELRSKGRVCFQHAPLSKDGEVYEGFENMYALNATNKVRPLVVDRDKTPLTQADGRPYSGCYVKVNVEVWAMDNQYGKRINATLMGVQFCRDGDAFGGGRTSSVDDFDDLGSLPAEELV